MWVHSVLTTHYHIHIPVFICAVMFPMDILEKGLEANNFGMLGLGDIVIPGEVSLPSRLSSLIECLMSQAC